MDTSLLNLLLEPVFDYLAPSQCCHCSARTKGALQILCGKCADLLKRRADEPFQVLPGFYGLVEFGDEIRSLIHQLKYRQCPSVADLAVSMLRWDHLPFRNPIWIPVPIHGARKRERGYNQATYIAHALRKKMGGIVCEQFLKRNTFQSSQTKLGMVDRYLNTEKAFSGKGKCPQAVVLVDDVLTTGSTLQACAEILRAHGALKVQAVCLAYEPKQNAHRDWERALKEWGEPFDTRNLVKQNL